MTRRLTVLLAAAALAAALPVRADWKWFNPPEDTELGIDVNASGQYLLADDFQCSATGPVTDITIWCSWLDDHYPFELYPPTAVTFTLGIHANIPAEESPTGFSIPGAVLWTRTFASGEFELMVAQEGIPEWWLTPPDTAVSPGDTVCWQYDFHIPTAEAFAQQGSPQEPVMYWLTVQAVPEDAAAYVGWKSSRSPSYGTAVWAVGSEPYTGLWTRLLSPPGHPAYPMPFDLSCLVGGMIVEQDYDWGDAPDPYYPTLGASTGARHVIDPSVHLGSSIDAEFDGLPSPQADGDDTNNLDDEDGVTFLTPLVPGTQAQVQMDASVPGYVSAWIDFHGDGDWATPCDRVLSGAAVPAGTTVFAVDVPAKATPGIPVGARVRFTTQPGELAFDGSAPDGEVEDQLVIVAPGDSGSKWIQHPDLRPLGMDVNASPYLGQLVLADDFLCTERGRITEISIWGSWVNDVLPWDDPSRVSFTLSLHADIPESLSGTGFSMPGGLLWVHTFEPGEFQTEVWLDGIEEGWYNPNDGMYSFPGDTVCWLYTFPIDLAEAFQQMGTPASPVVYWLDAQATPEDHRAIFGWKTSVSRWSDAAVWGPGAEPYVGPWMNLYYPTAHPTSPEPFDLAFAITSQPFPSDLDWGDAPDPLYPTLAASNGAGHGVVQGVCLGQTVDAEPDGLPDPAALGDDLSATDDEDGVTFLTALAPAMPGEVSVAASVPGYVSAWIDFDDDGDWSTDGDEILQSAWMAAGDTTFVVNVLQTAVPGTTVIARFRFTTLPGNLSFDGLSFDGEVEDYAVTIEPPSDWGDAPDPSYPTLRASNGASHAIDWDVYLGQEIDMEIDGLPGPDAQGDDLDDDGGFDDEDGVLFLGPVVPDGQAQVQVTASVAGYVSAWVDFNADGDWSTPGDCVLWGAWIPAGVNVLAIDVPATTTPGIRTFVRFRFTTAPGGLPVDGPASDGEVEDHELYTSYKWTQAPQLPDRGGMDVHASRTLVLADDFECRSPGRITDICVWGSWWGDHQPYDDPERVSFVLSIFADIPAGESPTGYSMPGDLLWSRAFGPEEFEASIWAVGPAGWYDPPDSLSYTTPADWTSWLYAFHVGPAEAFHQTGMPDDPLVYWLGVKALPDVFETSFGWKNTPLDQHWNDAAVWTTDGTGIWHDLSYPIGHELVGQPMDLAFRLITEYGTAVPEGSVPNRFNLRQNAPNPFNPTTAIEYDVQTGGGHVTIGVYDAAGRFVRGLVDRVMEQGTYSTMWDGCDERGSDVASGVYFLRMKAPGLEETRRMVLLK